MKSSSTTTEWTEADSRMVDLIVGIPAAGKPTEEQMTKDFDEVLEKAEAEEAKAARKARPIKVARFEV